MTYNREKREAAKSNQIDLLAELLFAGVTADKIEEKIAQFKTVREMSEALDISNLRDQATIDPLTIYCNVTGQPIGRVDERLLKMALHAKGKINPRELIEYGAQSSIAIHWQQVAGETLTKLSELDPCGYFVYAASQAFTHYYHNWMDKQKHENAIQRVQVLKQKIILFAKLQELPIGDVIAANEAWRDFLSLIDPQYAKSQIIFPVQVLSDFGNPDVVQGLKNKLSKIVASLLAKNHPQLSKLGPNDVANMRDKYKGMGTFGAQARLKDDNSHDMIVRLLETQIGPHVSGFKDYGSSTKRHNKAQAHQPIVPQSTKTSYQVKTKADRPMELKASETPAVPVPVGKQNALAAFLKATKKIKD